MCSTGKRTERTRRKAVVALDQVRAAAHKMPPGHRRECSFYRCDRCGFWHLTSRPKALQW